MADQVGEPEGLTRPSASSPAGSAPVRARTATIRHSIGVWPAVVNDETVAEKCVPLEELVLRAKTGPFGAARVTLRLSDIPDGCRVEKDEIAVRPPMSWVPHAVQAVAFWPRNRETLWRLGALAERLKPSELS